MKSAHKCPACNKPVTDKNNIWKPFCCERCKLIDLGAWLSGRNSIPGEGISPENYDTNIKKTRH